MTIKLSQMKISQLQSKNKLTLIKTTFHVLIMKIEKTPLCFEFLNNLEDLKWL